MFYFIGYNLEGRSAQLVDNLKHSIADKCYVSEALRIPPHLTLFTPFEMEEGGLEHLLRGLTEVSREIDPFTVKITGFNHFGERVWFLDVEQSERLMDLKTKIVKMMAAKFAIPEDTGGRKGVHFHLTLAYKDVTPEKFKLIGDYLEGQDLPIEKLDIGAIVLFEKKAGNWQVISRFGLGNTA